MRRINWVLVMLLVPVFMLLMWGADVLGTVFRPQPHPYQAFGFFTKKPGYYFDSPTLRWFDPDMLKGAPEVLLGLYSNGRAIYLRLSEGNLGKNSVVLEYGGKKQMGIDEAAQVVRVAHKYGIKAAFGASGLFRLEGDGVVISIVVGDLDVFEPGCEIHHSENGLLFSPSKQAMTDPFGGYSCPVGGHITYHYVPLDRLDTSVRLEKGAVASVGDFAFLAPSRDVFETFLKEAFSDEGFYDKKSGLRVLGSRMIALGVAVLILGIISLLLLVPYVYLSTYRAVLSKGRELYVLYAAGIPQISLISRFVYPLAYEVGLPFVVAWLMVEAFRITGIWGITVSPGSLMPVFGISTATSKGIFVPYHVAPTWRLGLALAVLLVLAVDRWFAVSSGMRAVFKSRGIVVLSPRSLIAVSLLLVFVLSIFYVWLFSAGVRIWERYSIYSIHDFLVCDFDVSLCFQKVGDVLAYMEKKGGNGLIVSLSVRDGAIHWCGFGSGKDIAEKVLPAIKDLWGATEDVNVCSADKLYSPVAVIFWIHRADLDEMFKYIQQMDKQMFSQLSPQQQSVLLGTIEAAHSALRQSFMESYRHMFNMLVLTGVYFVLVLIFMVLLFGAGLKEFADVYIRIFPYRVAVLMVSGRTLRRAISEILSQLFTSLIISVSVGLVAGCVASYYLFVYMRWKIYWLSYTAVPVIFLLFVIMSLVAVYVSEQRVKKGGIVAVLKRDL